LIVKIGAAKAFIKIIELDKTNIRALLQLALCFKAAGHLKECMDKYYRVIELEPDNEVALYQLGLILLDDKQFLEANRMLRKYLKIHPFNKQAWFYLGISCYKSGDIAGALDSWEKGVDGGHDSPFSWYNIGKMLFNRKDWFLSEIAFKNALKQDEQDHKALYYLARIKLLTSSLEEAEMHVRNAVQLAPNNPEYQALLDLVQEKKSKHTT